MRKIVVHGKEYLWSCGKYYINIKDKETGKKIYSKTIAETFNDPDNWHTIPVQPHHIESIIKRVA